MTTTAPPMTPKEIRFLKVKAVRQKHESLLSAHNVSEKQFGCKSAVTNPGPFELPMGKVGFFESELKNGDFYFEITTLDIETTNGVLYKLTFDPNFKTNTDKYQFIAVTPTKNPMYYVNPTSFERVVFPVSEDPFELPTFKEDSPLSELTARDHACIILKVPDTNKEWLNDLIAKSI